MVEPCICGLLAFDPEPCEQCANPEPYPDGTPSARPHLDRLCSGCRSICAECKETCCDYHKDATKARCCRCMAANGE